MSSYKLTYKAYGERSVLIEWPAIIDENINKDIVIFKKHIENNIIKQIVDINIGYNSLLIIYTSTIKNIYTVFLQLKSLYSLKKNDKMASVKLWKIPVCYEDDFAIDLNAFSKQKNLSKNDVITLHSVAIYTVYFTGFLPGFLYLGGLDKKLFLDRKNKPNLKVEKGAVGIGGKQTGIYPQTSPGGWHIIGNSPINFFKVNNQPCFAKSGDKIQFKSISKETYYNIKRKVNSGTYKLESHVIHH